MAETQDIHVKLNSDDISNLTIRMVAIKAASRLFQGEAYEQYSHKSTTFDMIESAMTIEDYLKGGYTNDR